MYLSLELLLGGIGAGSTIGGILLWIIKRIWWDKRKWYRDMYDLVDKMVPFSPVIIKGINEDFGSKSDIYSEEYSTVMGHVPGKINEKYRNKPTGDSIDEDFVNCLCQEGYSIERQLEDLDRGDEINTLEFLNSVYITNAVSLVIKYQIEEEVRWFWTKKFTHAL